MWITHEGFMYSIFKDWMSRWHGKPSSFERTLSVLLSLSPFLSSSFFLSLSSFLSSSFHPSSPLHSSSPLHPFSPFHPTSLHPSSHRSDTQLNTDTPFINVYLACRGFLCNFLYLFFTLNNHHAMNHYHWHYSIRTRRHIQPHTWKSLV